LATALSGDLAVWDGHVAMIVCTRMMIETRCQLGVQNDRRHGIALPTSYAPEAEWLTAQTLWPIPAQLRSGPVELAAVAAEAGEGVGAARFQRAA
jgi:hypothetical protein